MARGARHQQPAAGLGGHGRAGGRGQPLSPRRWVPGFPQSRDCSHQRMGRGSVAGLPAGPKFTARLSQLVAQLLVPTPPPSRASTPVTRCCSADHLEDRIAPVFADLDRPDSAGCAYAVVQDGELIATGGYGSAQLEHGVAIDPQRPSSTWPRSPSSSPHLRSPCSSTCGTLCGSTDAPSARPVCQSARSSSACCDGHGDGTVRRSNRLHSR